MSYSFLATFYISVPCYILINQIKNYSFSVHSKFIYFNSTSCKKISKRGEWRNPTIAFRFLSIQRSREHSWIKFAIAMPRNYCIMHGNKNFLKSLANTHATRNFVCFNILLAFYEHKVKNAKIHRARNFLFYIRAHISKVFYDVNLCYTQSRAGSDDHTKWRGKSANCDARTNSDPNEVSEKVM